MSYILDALKKSEQERKKGTVPGLGTIQGLPGGNSEDNWFIRNYLWGTLVLLITAGVLAWLFLREQPPNKPEMPTATALQTTGTPVKTNATEATLPGKSARRTESGRPSEESTAPQATAHPRAAALKPTPTKDTAPKAPALAPPPTGATPEKTAPLAKVPMPETPPPLVTAGKSAPPPAQMRESAESEPPPGDTPAEEPEVHVKPEDMPIVPLAELPAEVKSEMPEVKIGLHFFSEDPASRRAGVNGRLLREGQLVEKDLNLMEITREGVILSFRGRRFSLAVFPR